MKRESLQQRIDDTVRAFSAQVPLRELPAGAYETMRYPRFPAVMRFYVRRYAAKGFGNVFTMYTRALSGLMQLATMAFTPNAGGDVPLLLIDVMAMGKKRTVFIEYYDCTARGVNCPELAKVKEQYGDLPEYPEKPAWYVGERTPDSLIKSGEDGAALFSMLADSVSAYAAVAAQHQTPSADNLTGLAAFIERMVREGNPSTATMEKLLGKAGAEAFFRAAVMPKDYTEQAF